MPSDVFSLGVLLLLVVPGYLFLRGYSQGRSEVAASQPDLWVLAESVVVSLALLAISGLIVGWTLVDWQHDGKLLTSHRDYAVAYFIALSVGSWSLGAVGGLLLRKVGENPARLSRWPFRWIAPLTGAWKPPELWNELMAELKAAHQPAILRVTTKNGQVIHGAFDARSSARGAPVDRELRMSKVYRLDGDELVQIGSAVYLRGSDIESVSILGYSEV